MRNDVPDMSQESGQSPESVSDLLASGLICLGDVSMLTKGFFTGQALDGSTEWPSIWKVWFPH